MKNYTLLLSYRKGLLTALLFLAFFITNAQSLQWSTYLNTTDDENLSGMTKDNAGNIYIIGGTKGNGFPVTPGAAQTGLGTATNKLTITKISAATGNIIWSTYYGGDDDKIGYARFYWDSASNSLCIVGVTSSDNFPVVNGNPKTSTSVFSPVLCQFDGATGNVLYSTYIFPVNCLYFNYRTIFADGKLYFLTMDSAFSTLLLAKINLTTHQFVYNKAIATSTGSYQSPSGIAYLQLAVNNGEAYINGSTSATDYPVTAGAYQTQFPAGGPQAYFITKLDVAGNIGFSTYANAVDNDYTFYISPMAVSNSEVAIASTFGNGLPVSPGGIGFDDIEETNLGLLKFDKQTGALLYATYLGANIDYFPIREIRYAGKELIINGTTQSAYLPVTPNAMQQYNSYGLNDGSSGGDCFIMHFDSSNRIVYCSYVGGNRNENFQSSVISGQDIYFFGSTNSSNFPVTPNATQQLLKGDGTSSDLILVKYNIPARKITYSSYLGSSGYDSYGGIPTVSGNYVYLNATAYHSALYSLTNDFPVTPDAFQKTVIGSLNPSAHQYVAKVNTNTGKLAYGSYIGSTLTGSGENTQVLVAKDNDVFLTGVTSSNDYPVTSGAISTTQLGLKDIFVTKLTLCGSNVINDTLSPHIMSVCVGSLVDTIRGAVPMLDNAPAIIRNGVSQAQPAVGNFTYQWEVSTDSITWSDISGALQKDYMPEPVNVKTYFRRIAKGVYCTNVHTSSVTTLNLNGFIATKPDVGSGGAFFACPGNNITLGTAPAAGVTYNWQPVVHLSAANTAQAVFNNAAAGAYTYILFATDSHGCTAMDTATVFNYKASAGVDKVLCPDKNTQIGSAPLAGLAGVTYNWSPATGLSCANCAQPLVNTSGTYILTVNVPLPQGGNCITKDTVSVSTGSQLINPAGPDQTICNNTVITLGTPRVPGYIYNWSPGVFLSNINNTSQPVFNQLNSNIYLLYNPINYILTATNPAGCTTVDTAKVYLVDPYAGYRTCRPSPLGKTDYTRGQATYEWVDITSGTEAPVAPGELSSTTISKPVALANTTIGDKAYRVKMTWNGVTCSSDVIVLNSCGGCPGVDIKFISKSGCPNVINNDSVRMYVNNPDPRYIYVWTPSTGLNRNIGTEVLTGVNTSTEYTVTAVNIYDSAVNCFNTIKINFFTPSAPAFHAPDKIICKNEVSNIGLAPVAGLDYMWTNDYSFGSVVDFTSDPMVTGAQTMNYYVKVTDPVSNCFVNDTVVVTVPYIPVDGGPSRPSCSNGGFTIGTPAIAGFIYNWTPGTGLSTASAAQPTVVSNAADIDYILSVTDPASGCIAKDTVSITHTDNPTLDPMPIPAPYCQGSNATVQLGNPELNNVTYSWSPATGLSDPNIAQPIASPQVTTVYTVTANFSGACATPATESVTVTVIPKPDVSVTVSDNCSNSQLTTITNAAFPAYTWTPATALSDPYSANPVSTTSVPITYEVLVHDQGSGCENTATATVLPPVAADAGEDVELCEGGTVQIGSAATPGISYSWQPASGLGNYNTSHPNTLSTLFPGTYTYVMSASSGSCTRTDTIIVKVNPKPLLNTNNVTICKFASVQLGVSPEPLVTYNWSPPIGLSDVSASNPQASPMQTTTYTVDAVNIATGCTSNGNVTVTVNTTGAPAVSAAGNNTCRGVATQLTANVTGTGPFTYVWTPDIDFIGSRFISNPMVQPAATITYQVLVTNTVNGCANTADATVTVTDTCNVMPLSWLSFTAVLKENKTMLEWRVNMEQDNKEFVVERSADGNRWTAISTVASRGNTTSERTYQSVDASPMAGVSFYRIKQMDVNGRATYSAIRSIRTGSNEPVFVIYPNPTHDILHYELQNGSNTINAQLQLHSTDGRLVKEMHISSTNGSLSLSHLPAGVYIVTLTDNKGIMENKKVVLQK